MRKILFRGFHERADGDTTIFVDGREARGQWVEGYYTINGDGNYCIDEVNSLNMWEKSYTIIPSTRGEYTGLTDKNGKKIFEGDIVKEIYYRLDGRIENATYIVAWNGFCVGFHLIFETGRAEVTTYLTKNGMYEIIGTIFGNAQEVTL